MDDFQQEIMELLQERDPHQKEFHQAVKEVLSSLKPVLEKEEKYRKVLYRMVEPEKLIQFQVPWIDDQGETHVNRGFRVQFNSALGPYKGGLRFHPSVNQSILKFLGFEQTLKNALTGLPMGGGKGGSDFDPKGKSDLEVMRFCHAFMLQLRTHIGPDTDVPAGDIGVGGREIGYLFGMYKKLSREFHGVLTGKGVGWGGSEMRTEATGYGLIFYLREMLKEREIPLEEAAALISGSGNVAIHAAEKLMELGGKVLSLSDSKGYIHVPEGLTEAQLKWIKDLKFNKRGRISEAADKFDGIKFYKRKDDDSIGVWGIEGANIALPCATQNELNEDAAQALVSHSVTVVAEGANMPCTSEAVEVFRSKKVMYAPGKASNAGGVATSGLEMQQNAMHSHWKRKEVADKLEEIMVNIYRLCSDTAKEYDREGDLAFGANIAGFLKTADAMISEGVV